ncbi:hypothetical protein Cgig2_002972 [Carnegiea gigantea]|uniref:Uncharacterized protein n=1 Tax=Carnegiea gigantea TaxID=171969 RepID=A0A9Q1K566_9CARY|nr:hypothetical protein Cgig2_002972 [Carnegiea gigantea]
MEPSTPSTMSSNVPIISMHDASIIYADDFSSTSVVSTPMVMLHPSLAPMLTHPAFSVSCSHTTTTSPTTPPLYPFYFNNFPPICNSHPSLPLYSPNGSIFQPLPSTSRSLHGYSQFEVGSSSSAPLPVPQSDFMHYTLLGLGREYETLVTTLTHVPHEPYL